MVDAQQLDKLYYSPDKTTPKPKPIPKEAFVYGASVLFPLITGALIHKACNAPYIGKGLGQQFLRGMQQFANHLDHRRGIFISLASLFGAATVFNIGLFSAARSPNERREVIMKKVPMQTTFFLGDLALMYLANLRYLKKRGIKPTSHIEEGLQRAHQQLKQTVGKRLAKTFWGMFAINTLLVGGLVVFNNWLTTARVRKEALQNQLQNNWANTLQWPGHPTLPQASQWAQ